MRTVSVREPGAPDVMEIVDAPVPVPRAGELLIRVQAAGVNRPDLMQRKGLYPPPKDASPVLGLEVAGEVAALGEGATAYNVGDRVCALVNGGGYAEYCAAPAGQCLPWPAGFDAVRAAALPENYFTVWSNLFRAGNLRAGQSVLVHGGAGGIGTTAIQLARARGARVFATAGSAEKCRLCETLGAEAGINYREERFADRVKELTGGRGVDMVLDMIGASYLEPNLRSLAEDGRLVVVALQGGAVAEKLDLARVMTRRLAITGSTLRPRTAAYKAELASALREEVWPLLERGEIAPLMHAVLPFTSVVDAHTLMESGSHAGKIVLSLD
jgi:NADPH:quinone reductase